MDFFGEASDIVWGPPVLILLGGTDITLALLLKGLQFRGLMHSLYPELLLKGQR